MERPNNIIKMKKKHLIIIFINLSTIFAISEDIYRYNDVGVFNFLIGESILKSKNISQKINELVNK